MYKLINNAVYRKQIKKLRNRIVVRLVNNKKDWNGHQKWTLKPRYMSQKNLKIIRKSKVLLTLNKQAYVEMCLLLDLNKVLK